MASTPDLKTLISETIDKEVEENFADRADQAGLSRDRLIDLALKKETEITQVAASFQTTIEELQRNYKATLKLRVERVLEQEARWFKVFRWALFVLTPLVAAALPIKYFQIQRFNLWMISDRPAWQIITGVLIVLGVLFGIYNGRKEQLDKNRSDKLKALEEEQEFTDLKKLITDAEKERDATIIAQGIKPQLREIIASHLKLEFSKKLEKLKFPGLSEVFNSANEIATDAKRELEFMLNTMPGGSIGIAGPRGLVNRRCSNPPAIYLTISKSAW